MALKESDIYRGMALPWKGSLASLVEVKGDKDVLASSVYWILLTKLGERVMRPEFGSRLSELVFEPNRQETLDEFETVIQSALDRWDDRVQLENVDFIIDQNTLECRIKWSRRLHGKEVVENTVLVIDSEVFIS